MIRKLTALALAVLMLAPALALAEGAALPFGLALGMNGDQARAAFAADPVLSALTPDKEEYGTSVDYYFEGVAIPGTELIADELSVSIDQNNSQKQDRLTSVTFTISPSEHSIADFRALLAALTAMLGAPESDPFGEDAVAAYVEWGTLDASWATADMRVALTMNRMYEESVTLQYNSRLNYDAADLAR